MDLTEPWLRNERFRIEMTVGCRDCDHIAKVEQAGAVIDENGSPVQIMHNGLRITKDCYYGSWMTEIITRLSGHHEPQEEKVFDELLKHVGPNATMIELGGYWAYYSMWFLRQAPNTRRSIVVEPKPDNLAVGKTNAALNGLNIEFLHAYLGSPLPADSPIAAEFASAPHELVPDLLEKFGIETLDILHCDTQGAETAILESCEDLLKNHRIRFCVISTHSHYISGDPLTHQKCLAILQKAGVKILSEHDVHESFSGDGLIVAYSGREPLALEHIPTSLNRYSTSLYRNPLFDLDDSVKAAKKPPAPTSVGISVGPAAGLQSDAGAQPPTTSRRLWPKKRELRKIGRRLLGMPPR
ncbi:MAG: FkbM family methyltransferase [Hyphomicrobium sp.]|uniref:FkbM family methyltransferase n=1 Tax=Hyphomicrobium sp. TaxID=82 RepID=UPI0039E3D122